MTDGGVLLKHYYQLSKNIDSFSGGQARLGEGTDDQEDALTTVNVSIAPTSGPYRGGRFDFTLDMSEGYPSCPPAVRALTKMYHPNVELADAEDEEDGSVCVNLLDELWTPAMTLEDVVQGLLFLLHNPNVEDPLSSLFCGSEDEDEFRRNVRLSLRGGNVAGVDFKRNLLDGYESECEEDDDEEGAPGNQSNLESTVATLLEELVEKEDMDVTIATSAASAEIQKNFISTLNVIAETDETPENDASTEEETPECVTPFSPSLFSRSTQLAGSRETNTDKDKQFTLFSQLRAPLWSFDKMWTLSLSSIVRTIVLGAQRVSRPLARLDSSEMDVH